MTKNAVPPYTSAFFADQAAGSARSASVVVPLVLSLLPAQSVVDIGCGVGTWASEFVANGVTDVLGIDGDYVDRSQLRISPSRFLVRDITESLQLDRTFDLAVCLEVAEHLPESRARGLVADLTALASCVLFSAAVPGQRGTHHINSQYLPYWIDCFQRQGYEGIDPIRPKILGNNEVEWWYQQNTIMFAAPQHPLLAMGFQRPRTFIHEDLYELVRNPGPPPLGRLVSAFPHSVARSVRYHLGLR